MDLIGGDDEAVREHLSTVLDGCRPMPIRAVRKFPHGENHAVYRVSSLDEFDVERDIVVRVSNSDSDADRAQAEREAAVLDHLRGLVSPRLLHFGLSPIFGGRAVMCLEFVAGRVTRLGTASPDRMANLGSVVRRTHEVPVHDLAAVLPYTRDLSTYVDGRLVSMMSRMALVRDPLPEPTQSMFTNAARWAEQIAHRLRVAHDPGLPTLLHGDVSAGNILWTPEPVLIDWEYARIGDPADEIGYLFGQNALRAGQREGFWRGYGRGLEPSALDRMVDRVGAWEPLTLFGSALYWIDLWSRRVRAEASDITDPAAPKDPAYYLDFATRYLNRWNRLHQRL